MNESEIRAIIASAAGDIMSKEVQDALKRFDYKMERAFDDYMRHRFPFADAARIALAERMAFNQDLSPSDPIQVAARKILAEVLK